MKKFKKLAFSLLMFFLMIINVNAETVQVDTADKLLEAVSNGGEIRLTDNIDLGEFVGEKVKIAVGTEITLDLNGFTISGKSSDETKNAKLIQNNGTLVINDSSEEGTGKITLTDTGVALGAYSVGSYTIKNEGTLVVNNGTIENTGTTDVPYPIDNDTTNRNATVTINGGTIVGQKAAIRAFCNSVKNENKIIINDGNITAGNSAVWISQVSKKANKGYLEVNGGTIYGKKNNGIYLSVFDQTLFSNIIVKITGGTIKNNSETSAAFMYEPWNTESDLANAVINLEITGGKFINENANGRAFVEPAYVDIPVTYTNISGGSYSSDVSEYIATGVVSRKIGDMYTVGKENNVSIENVSLGEASVDKTTAIAGETVTLTLTPDNGYELSTIKVVDANGKEVAVTDNQFVMPNSNVTINVDFTKVTITSELPVLDTTQEVEKVTVGIKDKATVEDILLETISNDEELSTKVEDASVKVEIEIVPVNSSNVSDEVEKAMKEKAENAIIANYFDVSITLKDEKGTINETISELTQEIELMVALPEELRNNNKDITRKYYIVREHIVDGESQVDLLEAKLSEDGKYLTFKTDKFSTYALAYEDVKVVNNPNTGDNIMFYIVLGFVSFLACGISTNSFKKKVLR